MSNTDEIAELRRQLECCRAERDALRGSVEKIVDERARLATLSLGEFVKQGNSRLLAAIDAARAALGEVTQ